MKCYKFILLLCCAAVIFGCEGQGKLKVNNYTSGKVFFTFNGNSYVLQDSTYRVVSKDIKKSWNPFKTNDKKVDLRIFGETFVMEKDGAEEYDTQVTLEVGKTVSVFCYANRACVEIQNKTDHAIVDFRYKLFLDGEFERESDILLPEPALNTDEYYFHRLIGSTDTEELSYVFSATDSLDHEVISSRVELKKNQKFYFVVE